MFVGTIGTIGRVQAVAAGAATTWNPADKTANIVLSNSNRTALANSSAQAGVRGVTPRSSGDYTFEGTYDSGSAGAWAIGLAASTEPLGGLDYSGAVILFANGDLANNGAFPPSVSSLSIGDFVQVRFSGGNTVRFYRNGTLLTTLTVTARNYFPYFLNNGLSVCQTTLSAVPSLPSGSTTWG